MSVLSRIAGALMVACGTLTITTGAVGTTFSVTSLPFQPTALFFAWSGKSGTGAAEEDSRFGAGMAVSPSSRRAHSTFSDHAVGTAATQRRSQSDCCVLSLSVAGAVNGAADLDAILSNGFRLIVDTQFAAAMDVIWFAWDATNAQIVDFLDPSGTGTQNYATTFALNTGIDDKAVIILGNGWADYGTAAAASCLSVGVAAGDTPVNAVLGAGARNGGTSDTACYCHTGECIGTALSTGVEHRAALTAWLSTGFTLNWTEAPNFGTRFSALVMQGGNRWLVGDALTSTGTSNQTEATAYTPTGLIIGSHCKAQSSADTVQLHDERSIGFATSPTERHCVSLCDADGLNTSDMAIGVHSDRVYMNYLESNVLKTTVSGIGDLVSFDATPSFTYVMDDADPAASYFWYLLTADAAGSGTFELNAEAGAYALSGLDASPVSARLLHAEPGVYGVTGAAASTVVGRMVSADPGAYGITGAPAGVLATRVLNAESGSYAITGALASTLVGRVLNGEPGSYALGGVDALLLHATPNVVLNAEPGTYGIAGADAELSVGRLLVADPGAYAISGAAVDFSRTAVLIALPGSYDLVGADAGLVPGTSTVFVVFGKASDLTSIVQAYQIVNRIMALDLSTQMEAYEVRTTDG